MKLTILRSLLVSVLALGVWAQERPASASDAAYNQAMKLIDDRQWQAAAAAFDNLAKQASPRADASLYWKAYAQNKLGRRDEALASIAELRKSHPSSRWVNDASALEVEIRQSMGQPVSPENIADDDLKLMALNGLMHSDPQRALPILQKIIAGPQSPKLKERALFILAQSSSPQARQILGDIARGSSNPDLQRRAIRSLAVSGNKENRQIMTEVYNSNAAPEVKKEIIRGFMISGDKERIGALARTEKDPALRSEAIRQLGVMGDQATLSALYASETSPELRKEILQAFMVGGASDRLLEAANNEKDPELRKKAIQLLGVMGRGKTGDALVQLYNKETEVSIKKHVLNALFIQGNAKPLIEIARKEQNADLKREAVQKLSLMKSPESTEYMLELLNK
ncbi:MAG: HEAT repeat domain-containing protein [Bryobacteraceae bacterium]|nr:HEAT repeat domain-containing protein [Bryobacteraceae bacterium]